MINPLDTYMELHLEHDGLLYGVLACPEAVLVAIVAQERAFLAGREIAVLAT